MINGNGVKRGFIKHLETQSKIRELVNNTRLREPMALKPGEDEAPIEEFARWCISNGAARVNDNVVQNMKSALLAVLTDKRKSTKEFKELQQRALLCLAKASDEIFDDANRLDNSDQPENIVLAVRETYEEKFKMVLWR